MLSLAALRLLAAGKDKDKTLALRRYVLGLSLTAFTMNGSGYLRAGCNLVPNPDKPRELTLVHADGKREASSLMHDDAVKYAELAAKAFGVGKGETVPFDTERAKKDVAGDEGAEKKKGGKKK
jgi:CRISPR-associated protein Csb1